MNDGSASEKAPAVFLDRDGTINVEKDYLFKCEDFEFIAGVPEAIQRLNAAGLKVIVVSNQSGVARGFYGLADINRLHQHVDRLLDASGAWIDGYYICPHHPDYDQVDCDCRKPSAGLLLQAAAEFNLDLQHCWMVGDKLADIQAGLNVGCHPVLVETGYGGDFVPEVKLLRVPVAKSLVEAVGIILDSSDRAELLL